MQAAQKIEHLKLLMGSLDGTRSHASLNCSLYSESIPQGAITQVSGFGKTQFAAQLLAEHPELRVAWIEGEWSIYPCALMQKNIDLHRILFVHAQKDIVWATLQALKSSLFPIVVVTHDISDERVLRKIQLAAENAKSSVILLTQKPKHLWPIKLSITINRGANHEGSMSIITR